MGKDKIINKIYENLNKTLKIKIKPKVCMIPQRLERQTYFYQKYTLPIKLRNLYLQSRSLIKLLLFLYLYLSFLSRFYT